MFRQNIHYSKPQQIDITELQTKYFHPEYNSFNIDKLQLYNPIYKRFFDMNENNYDKIALNHCYHIRDLEHVTCAKTNAHLAFGPKMIKIQDGVGTGPFIDPDSQYRMYFETDKDHITSTNIVVTIRSTPV